MAGSRRNYLGMSDTYFIPQANHNAVSLSMGKARIRCAWPTA